MAHLLSCRLLVEATVTERAMACDRKWEKMVWRTRKKKNSIQAQIRGKIFSLENIFAWTTAHPNYKLGADTKSPIVKECRNYKKK